MSRAEYRAAHREELAAKQRARNAANPDYMKQYRIDNAEQISAKSREWRAANADRIAAYPNRWKQAKAQRAIERRAMLEATKEERYIRRLALIREWQRNHPDLVKGYQRIVRLARRKAPMIDRVDRLVVYEASKGLCGICGDPVDITAFEVDHIIPLSRGGEHSYANTQAAHRYCNRSKRNKLPAEHAGIGLREPTATLAA